MLHELIIGLRHGERWQSLGASGSVLRFEGLGAKRSRESVEVN